MFLHYAVGGVYLAERLNRILASNWKSFAGQNYFDANGLFLSVLWSGPLLVIAIIILVSCKLNIYNINHSFVMISCINFVCFFLPRIGEHSVFIVLPDCEMEKSRAQASCKSSS